jgi:hypothetical protein
MWDTVVEQTSTLTHEMPCVVCGHAPHTYLPCSDFCDCASSPALTLPAACPAIAV